MINYFEEKVHQVDPSMMTAFGITIHTRYGVASELSNMIRFAERAAQAGVAHYVKSLFYDSKACVCSFELDPIVQDGDPVSSKLLEAAKGTIAQFTWLDGDVYNDFFDEYEEDAGTIGEQSSTE